MNFLKLARVLMLSAVTGTVALAQGTTGPGSETESEARTPGPDTAETRAAKELLTKYLTAVKAKKWAEARKQLHPETLKAIAERKKRLGREDHPMAPWSYEKTESYLKEFKVVDARPSAGGTVTVETSEDNYQVEEKGVAEGEMASYLTGRKDGKWYVVDKKRSETFTDDSIKLGYKNYFDKAASAP